MAEIQPADALAPLKAIEKKGNYETARRLRSFIGAVFRYAIATQRAQQDPTTALVGALITPKVTPRAAIIDPEKLGGLLRAIDGFDGQPSIKAALQLMALLFPRPGELRFATWSEFDMVKAVWAIPSEHAKMRRPHFIPLPGQAIAILQEARGQAAANSLALSNLRGPSRPMSENTMNAALRRLGYAADEMTPHGFRATASTLLNESGLWNADAIERQLGHLEGNDVRRAYARGQHWEERVRLMQWWADHLDQLRGQGASDLKRAASANDQ